MKKIYENPNMLILHIGKEITTDVIAVSNAGYGAGDGEKVYAPTVRSIDDWYEGY